MSGWADILQTRIVQAATEAPWLFGAWLVFFVAFALYLALSNAVLRRSYVSVALLMGPVLALGVLLVWTLVRAFDPTLEKVAVGLVGGTTLAFGWIVTNLAAEFRAAALRDKSRRDTLLALRSEIFAVVDKLDNQNIRQNADIVQTKIMSGEGAKEYYPFSIVESSPIVFYALSDSITALENERLVSRVLRFYAEFSDLQQFVSTLSGRQYEKLSRDRRIALHAEMTRRRITVLQWGLTAAVTINYELGVPDPTGIARSGQNPDINPWPI